MREEGVWSHAIRVQTCRPAARVQRWTLFNGGDIPGFLPEDHELRDGNWRIAPPPPDLEGRRVEVTGPVERKMIIKALNSGADVFMADFEDALSPAWENVVQGQLNLYDAERRTIEYVNPDDREYRLNDRVTTLVVRPRGGHLSEQHVLVDEQPTAESLLDFDLYVFHIACELLGRGSGLYFCLPKLESHQGARLWAGVFKFAEGALAVPPESIRATVLIGGGSMRSASRRPSFPVGIRSPTSRL